MTSLRPMMVEDLLHFNAVNLDTWTETFNMNFYFNYLTRWPECCAVAEADGQIAGYIIGKVEGVGPEWHGHVSAISVAPEFRRTGVANRLMEYLEEVSEKVHDCYFVDLFVRPTNTAAIKFYEGLGYVVYRTVTGYYSGDEDAFDMRKPLPRAAGTRLIKKIGRHLVKVCCWLLAANLRMSCASPLRTLASGFPRKPSTLGRAEALLGFDVEAAQPPLAWTLRTRLQKKVAPAAPATKEKVDKQKRDRAHVGFYLEFVDSLKLQHFVSTGRPVEVEGLGPEV
ncbi:nat5 [Symbiodinium natans]|uniref:Nat5 protein n=1 Tax=Symbiodinium natans TaxID=878477 RepID=A0A812GBS0_9DINO|nr:nat5 [Symbiodinium natans]